VLDAIDGSVQSGRMIWRSLAVGTTLFLFGCSSSSSDAGAAGGAPAGAGAGGAPTAGAGTSMGGTAAGEANAGAPSAGATAAAGASGGSAPAGAGGSGGSDDLPALDPAADARKLSDADKGVLCDWVNEKLGGYGKMFECSPSGTVMTSPSQAVCVATSFKYQCEVSVQEVTTCMIARAPSHGCDSEFDTCHRLFCQ